MMVMTATACLQRLHRLLGTGNVAVLQRLPDLGQGAVARDSAAAASQPRKRLLCRTQITALQSRDQALEILLALLPIANGRALSGPDRSRTTYAHPHDGLLVTCKTNIGKIGTYLRAKLLHLFRGLRLICVECRKRERN
jgi:hypothetical protein